MSACQPLFLVSYAESTHRYNAVAATNVGTILFQGAQKAGLCDYRTIREKEKLKFPRDISKVCITRTRFAVLSQCLFQGHGLPQLLVKAMRTMVAASRMVHHSSPNVLTLYPGSQASRPCTMQGARVCPLIEPIELSKKIDTTKHYANQITRAYEFDWRLYAVKGGYNSFISR